ncbi:hypothetical protein BGZ60DRAFT_215588 [Tricladium varicosporioides]|nr:hypothetical protein BGZ60DRAFT_215588 [Hymenoscyphus varicosporioides]
MSPQMLPLSLSLPLLNLQLDANCEMRYLLRCAAKPSHDPSWLKAQSLVGYRAILNSSSFKRRDRMSRFGRWWPGSIVTSQTRRLLTNRFERHVWWMRNGTENVGIC